MGRAAQIKVSGATVENIGGKVHADKIKTGTFVRVSPVGYLAALFFLSFAAVFLAYLQQPTAALIILAASWLTIPLLAWFDRIVFDGESLRRTSFVSAFWNKLRRRTRRLKISDIEKIETQAIRALRSGGQVYYRYRSEVCGENLSFAFASGGKNFRQMVRALFPLVNEDKLDARSLELRDYLAEPKELEEKTRALHLPSAETLENTRVLSFRKDRKHLLSGNKTAANEHWTAKIEELRQAANELRISGSLRQSLEAFRRALMIAPRDGWLLFEFSRCLHSYAAATRQPRLMHRALASLRLAARSAESNAMLLARIGESFFQYGEIGRAEKTFKRVLELEKDNFRASYGLAEIALHEGKLAHVVHHYQAATRAASDEALKRWAREETDYFSLLNNDLNYMEAEFSRLGWLQYIERGSRICLRLMISGLITAVFGAFFDEAIIQVGMAVAASTAAIWVILTIVGKFMLERASVEVENDEE